MGRPLGRTPKPPEAKHLRLSLAFRPDHYHMLLERSRESGVSVSEVLRQILDKQQREEKL